MVFTSRLFYGSVWQTVILLPRKAVWLQIGALSFSYWMAAMLHTKNTENNWRAIHNIHKLIPHKLSQRQRDEEARQHVKRWNNKCRNEQKNRRTDTGNEFIVWQCKAFSFLHSLMEWTFLVWRLLLLPPLLPLRISIRPTKTLVIFCKKLQRHEH